MAREVRIQESHGQVTVTIPKSVAELKGFGKGVTAYWSDAGRGSLVLSISQHEPRKTKKPPEKHD